MQLITEPYLPQVDSWPRAGQHILAQFDEDSIIVYQAYRPSIGHFAAQHGYFGGEFSLSRMSWIKPGFLWMMYRSGWASKPGQEVVLAVRLKRSAFEAILVEAVHSNYIPRIYGSQELWQKAIQTSAVRLQWDPDHHPSGGKLERRALQLGLRDEFLKGYADEWIIEIEDISAFAREQYEHVQTGNYGQLLIPRETVYPVEDAALALKLGLHLNL